MRWSIANSIKLTQQDKMEILWKAILGRLPKKSEEPLFDNAPDDVMWALINSMNSGLGDKQMERRDLSTVWVSWGVVALGCDCGICSNAQAKSVIYIFLSGIEPVRQF